MDSYTYNKKHTSDAHIGLRAATLLIAITSVYFVAQSATADEHPLQSFNISFSQPVTIDEIVKASRNHNVQLVSLRDTFPLDEVEMTDFYFVPSNVKTSRAILEDYKAARARMLEVMKRNLEMLSMDPALSPEVRLRSARTIPSSESVANVNVDEIELVGSGRNAEFIAAKLRGSLERSARRSNDAMEETENSSDVSALALGSGTWAPKEGHVFAGPSPKSAVRYAGNLIWWNDVSGFANSLATYEHELWLNNFDGKTYFSQAENKSKQPLVTYASSNLPSPYIDTRASDSRARLSYTIGSSAAAKIKANTAHWYSTYFEIKPGNTHSDTAKLNGQLGRKDLSCGLVPLPLCIFPVSTQILVHEWNIPIPVPKGYRWVRP